jgi:3-methyl-2-oxobutanoate hydroxymethyltransferase
MSKITTTKLQTMKELGEKIVMLTGYDAVFAALMDKAEIDIILVGDSLGMVVQGSSNTVAVSMDDMEYHTGCVAAGVENGLVLGDLPFGSFHSPAVAMENAVRLLGAGAEMVKLEGAGPMLESVEYMTSRGVSVCGHLGLTPQTAHKLGGFKVQAREEAAAVQLMQDALAIEAAGAQLVVLECIPAPLATEVSTALSIPTIGIGAGGGCDGQVLVMHDMLGLVERAPKFVADFMQGNNSVEAAFRDYADQVRSGQFPSVEHQY